MQNIYPDNFEKKVGFDQIRKKLHNKCLSLMGKERVDNMDFQNNYDSVSRQLDEVSEFCRIITETENFPADHFYDLRQPLQKIRIEGRFLETAELFDLKRSLEAVRAISKFFKNQDKNIFPLLIKKVERVRIFPQIYERIDKIINKHGKIRDNASQELAQIRKNILSLQSGMSKRIHAILKQAQIDGIVDEDAAVSIRDGQAVIPVSASNKRKIKGIVYDESASGKTVYIEPNEIVEINNEIRELQYSERREIVRILTGFSDYLRPYIEELFYYHDFLGEIDFIRTKALLAIEFSAIRPELIGTPFIKWEQAIHPLLLQSLNREKRKIVPLDILIDDQNHILMISGPNAGGKSVCLKTVGLLQYMLQCGLLIPLSEGSVTGIFEKIFIHIGDEQSLENDLSTYSSHLLNMKYFIKNCNENTLVLIDEFGAGTEPVLGAAIAEAILEELLKIRTFGLITTHYTNLKHFASSTKGIINGAMLYDSQHMNPLFRLDIGKPGSSFAFEIARKIGLPESILTKATEKVGKEHIDFDRNLRKINRDKRYWENKRQRIKKVEKILDDLAVCYESELRKTKKMRNEIMEKASEEADKMLAGVNKKIENTILEIKKAQAEKEKTKKVRQKMKNIKSFVEMKSGEQDSLINAKIEKLRRMENKRNKHRPADSKTNAPLRSPQKITELQKGDKVRLKGQTAVGDLIELNEKNAVVAFGQLITTLPRERVEQISSNEAKKIEKATKSTSSLIVGSLSEKRLSFRPEIDVRGQRVEEAVDNIRKFIDEAIMFEQRKLRILHGKGHGILKETIREYLKSEPMVQSIEDEHVDLGGAGITLVILRL
jgi:DNA mismatch repair protein MutS2